MLEIKSYNYGLSIRPLRISCHAQNFDFQIQISRHNEEKYRKQKRATPKSREPPKISALINHLGPASVMLGSESGFHPVTRSDLKK